MTPVIWHIYVGAGQPNDGKLAANAEQFVKHSDYAALEARCHEQQSENERLARISLAARALLKYIDDHDWGHIPEGVTADTLRDLLTVSETPAEPITVLRECWNCGHDHDADQDIKFCHSCGAANPNSVGPQSNRSAKP